MIELVDGFNKWFAQHPEITRPITAALVMFLIAVYSGRIGWRIGLVGFLVALAWFPLPLATTSGPWLERFYFTAFALVSVVAGYCMILQRNPVYSALCFALVVLGTCGLFLLQAAPFLAAATIIVYAGAVIVTFLFVIMLAQQSGQAAYDSRFRQPVLASVTAAFLLATLLHALEQSRELGTAKVAAAEANADAAVAAKPIPLVSAPVAGKSTLSIPSASSAGVVGLGKSLFGDYLWGVELAGAILLVSTIGAILIAGRRKEAVA